MRCDCYVRLLSAEARFSLHYGAHSPTCPRYRVSLDPVDRANDEDFREKHTRLNERLGKRRSEVVDCEYDRANADYREESLADLAEDIS